MKLPCSLGIWQQTASSPIKAVPARTTRHCRVWSQLLCSLQELYDQRCFRESLTVFTPLTITTVCTPCLQGEDTEYWLLTIWLRNSLLPQAIQLLNEYQTHSTHTSHLHTSAHYAPALTQRLCINSAVEARHFSAFLCSHWSKQLQCKAALLCQFIWMQLKCVLIEILTDHAFWKVSKLHFFALNYKIT